MTERVWWRDGVIYEIAVPSFADFDGDGRGDLRGILERLDYLAALGIDAIWLTPVNASPMRDFGYDVTDYYAINPALGTMEDFEGLLAGCHARGIRVIMDFVLNHTSDEHPWFAESRSCRDALKREWYVWRDGNERGGPPNGWRAVVEGSAWTKDPATGQFYYHAFLPFQPDLNWRNPEVEEAMFEVARFWLDKGVDGFRLDLVNMLAEDEQLRENPRKLGLRPYDRQRHIHDRSQPESVEVARRLRRLVDGYPDRALVGEVYGQDPADTVAFLGSGQDALHLAFYLDFATRRSAAGFRRSVEQLEALMPPGGWPCYYLDNHDLARSFSRLGPPRHRLARAKVAAAMLLTLRGTPVLYYGQEIGMPRSRIPRWLMVDPIGLKFWPAPVGRDGSRTPMQWSPTPGAGFTASTPWIPVDRSCARCNVDDQAGDPGSLLAWYRALIALRKATPALHAGGYRALEGMPRGVFGYVREADAGAVTVLLNFGSRSCAVPTPGTGASRVLLSTHRASGETVTGADLTLGSHEATILG